MLLFEVKQHYTLHCSLRLTQQCSNIIIINKLVICIHTKKNDAMGLKATFSINLQFYC